MHQLKALEEKVLAEFPEATTELDLADNPNGRSFLDINWKENFATVGWQQEHGFAVWEELNTVFGQGPDKKVTSLEEAFDEVKRLFSS